MNTNKLKAARIEEITKLAKQPGVILTYDDEPVLVIATRFNSYKQDGLVLGDGWEHIKSW